MPSPGSIYPRKFIGNLKMNKYPRQCTINKKTHDIFVCVLFDWQKASKKCYLADYLASVALLATWGKVHTSNVNRNKKNSKSLIKPNKTISHFITSYFIFAHTTRLWCTVLNALPTWICGRDLAPLRLSDPTTRCAIMTHQVVPHNISGEWILRPRKSSLYNGVDCFIFFLNKQRLQRSHVLLLNWALYCYQHA